MKNITDKHPRETEASRLMASRMEYFNNTNCLNYNQAKRLEQLLDRDQRHSGWGK